MRNFTKMTLVVAALAVPALLPASAAAADPIEGAWFFSEGRVVVEPTGPGTFRGTITRETRFATCPHTVGERMWEITKTGENAYEGTHIWFVSPPCRENPDGPGTATWELVAVGGEERLRFCTTNPSPPGNTVCNDLQRAEPALTEQPPNEAFLSCTKSDVDISLNDLIRTGPKRNRAKVAGFALSSLAGTQVSVVGRIGKKEIDLGSAAVAPAGRFAATVGLPGGKAQIKKLRILVRSASGSSSKAVKLTRRTRLTKAVSKKGKTTIRGVLTAPRAKTLPKVTIEQRVKCKGKKQWKKVAATKQKPNRTYAKTFANPAGSISGIFRARTKYAKKKGAKAKAGTATPYSSVELK